MKTFHSALVVLGVVLLSGCAPVLIGAAGSAGYMAVQERGIATAAEDTKLKTLIKANLGNEKGGYLTKVGVIVLEGDVLLAGVVASDADKARAEEVARQVAGVKGVYNELMIGTYGLGDYTKDAWTTSKVRAGLVESKDIYSINYMLETVLKQVYIMGIAQNEQERYRALQIARSQEGVLGVHDFIKVLGTDTKE